MVNLNWNSVPPLARYTIRRRPNSNLIAYLGPILNTKLCGSHQARCQ